MQHQSENINVGHRGDRLSDQLFWRRISWRQNKSTHLRQIRSSTRLIRVRNELGDAKIEELHLTLRVNQDVRRLQVSMHDEVLVRMLHRGQNLQVQVQARTNR